MWNGEGKRAFSIPLKYKLVHTGMKDISKYIDIHTTIHTFHDHIRKWKMSGKIGIGSSIQKLAWIMQASNNTNCYKLCIPLYSLRKWHGRKENPIPSVVSNSSMTQWVSFFIWPFGYYQLDDPRQTAVDDLQNRVYIIDNDSALLTAVSIFERLQRAYSSHSSILAKCVTNANNIGSLVFSTSVKCLKSVILIWIKTSLNASYFDVNYSTIY